MISESGAADLRKTLPKARVKGTLCLPTGFAICPLGAFYGLFNKIALLSVKVDESKCVHCNACLRACKMDIRKVGDYECISCGECKEACKFGAIRFGWEKKNHKKDNG